MNATSTRRCRRVLLTGAAIMLTSAPVPLLAQVVEPSSDAAPPGDAPQSAPVVAETESRASEITVTGSRVVRDGYSAPTPLTVVSGEQIAKAATSNIADFVNQLPQLQPGTTPRTGTVGTSSGTAGLNLLDLRGLGTTRTLVLLDGRRVVPSTQTGSVDINNLPSALVQRVEVVTGGASAAYGSDAVAGVVNFIIDSKFEGMRASFQAGITDRSDNRQTNAQLAVGTSYGDGRGHLLISGEYAYEEGIDFLDPAKRDWYESTYLVNNPAFTPGSGVPQRLVADNVNYSTLAQGGLINFGTSAAGARINSVRGIQFGAGGQPLPFQYGTVAGTFMIGGNTWNEGNVPALTPQLKRGALWGRTTYEFSPAVRLTIEGSYGASASRGSAAYQRYVGNLTIPSTNPFLPQSVRDQLAAAGAASFNYGYSSFDLGRPVNVIDRDTYRLVGGLDGELGGGWRWNAYYQLGRTDLSIRLENTTNTANFARAIDVVQVGNSVVCRSTLTAPSNGCQPLNIFGIGVASPAAIAYVKGVATQDQRLSQDVAALGVTGELFQLPAGPVSVAFGAEHRREAVRAVGDPLSLINGWYTGNFKTNAGSYTVNEGFGEVVVPIVKDVPALQLLELNAAARVTDYSTSGTVVTWKGGLTYTPIEDLRFRFVRSRDIRAPNLSELYLAGQTQAQDVNDPARGNAIVRITRVTNGNLDLQPEEADTLSVGAVFNPTFLRQLGLSVDYYDIEVNGAITTLTNQDLVNRCFAGDATICPFVIRDSAGTLTQIVAVPINVASVRTRGLDVDLSFRQPLGDLFDGVGGTVTLRALATKVFTLRTTNAGASNEAVGENGGPQATASVPRLRTFVSLGYDDDRFSLTGFMRTISDGVYDVTWRSGVDIDDNTIKGAVYFDLAGSYRLHADGQSFVEAFFKVDNLLDRDPSTAASTTSSAVHTNPTLYDTIGRSYRAGLRMRF